jgi:hypothetical protein
MGASGELIHFLSQPGERLTGLGRMRTGHLGPQDETAPTFVPQGTLRSCPRPQARLWLKPVQVRGDQPGKPPLIAASSRFRQYARTTLQRGTR